MSFQGAAAGAYDRFMGRWSVRLAPLLADFAGIRGPAEVLDVGCGPGALTEELARRVGAGAVRAVDPSETFVAACRARVPGADVRTAAAESLPFPDASVGAALSQLAVNFMADAMTGAREMARVVRPGGTVAACTWGRGPAMELFYAFAQAALAVDPDGLKRGPADRHRSEEELAELWRGAGLTEVETTTLEVGASYAGFDEYWSGFAAGTGPHAEYLAGLDEALREEIRRRARANLGDPPGPFTLRARACAVRGRVAG